MKKIRVAIDGYSSTGKSTMAKALARTIGYRYIDSGAMYRAVTLYAFLHGMINIGTIDEKRIVSSLPEIRIGFELDSDSSQITTLNGRNVEREIRGIEISQLVSKVAAIPEVREAMVAQQRKLGENGGIVMDGRDIGTTVFPTAELKVFVTASAEVRAQRRFDELRKKGENVSYDKILQNVKERDHLDETRSVSPLRMADDALLLDNTDMSTDEQNQWLLKHFNSVVLQ